MCPGWRAGIELRRDRQRTTKLNGVIIGGSLVGGSADSGISSAATTWVPVKINGDVHGGTGGTTGGIRSNGKLAGVTIGGSLLGGSNTDSGEIFSIGDMGAVKIGHDLTGGSISVRRHPHCLRLHRERGRIASVTIGGSIISGLDSSSGGLTRNASIRAGNDIGSLTVKGSLIGSVGTAGSTVFAGRRVRARSGRAGRDDRPGHWQNQHRRPGRVRQYPRRLRHRLSSAVNGDAQIGAVTVGGDWVASNLVAGAMNAASGATGGNFGERGTNVNFGAMTGNAGSHHLAKIASITISGQVFGTPDSFSTTDHFGFVAEQIGALKIGGSAIAARHQPYPIGHRRVDDVSIHLMRSLDPPSNLSMRSHAPTLRRRSTIVQSGIGSRPPPSRHPLPKGAASTRAEANNGPAGQRWINRLLVNFKGANG